MNASNRDIFKTIGIADTRLYDLARAMEGLHSSLGKLDDSNHRRFIVWVDCFDSFADAMNAFAGQTSDWLQDFHLAGLRNDF